MEGRGSEDKTGGSRQPAVTGSNSWPVLAGCAANASFQQTGHLGPSSPLLLVCAVPLASVVLHQLVLEVMPVPGAGDSSGVEHGCTPEESAGAGWGLYPQDLPLGLTWGSSGAEDTELEHKLAAQGPRGLVLLLQRGWHPTEPACSSTAYSRYYAGYESGLLFLMLFFISEIAVSNLCCQTCLLTQHGRGWILSWCKAALAHQRTASPMTPI